MRSCILPGVLVAAALAACGRNDAPAPSAQPGTKRLDPVTAGTVTGRVVFAGQAPPPALVRIDSDPGCVSGGTTSLPDETLLVDATGGVKNAFVYVKTGLEEYAFDAPPSEPVLVDNKGCRYEPRVFGVRAGQPINVRNSDPTLHNVNAIANVNQEFNLSLPAQGLMVTETFTAPEIGIPFKCHVHPWMTSYGNVVEHPYFAVTGASGRFRLPNVPPGTYTLEVWHEKLGRQQQTITIGPKQSADAVFTFTG